MLLGVELRRGREVVNYRKIKEGFFMNILCFFSVIKGFREVFGVFI